MRTNAGADFQALVMSGASNGTSASASAKYIALTENSSAASASDTTLSGELAAASGGLVRVAATYAHTTAATSYTLTNTFTANTNDSPPKTPAKIGVFNAASTGTMVFETLITSPPVMQSGDTLTITETVSF